MRNRKKALHTLRWAEFVLLPTVPSSVTNFLGTLLSHMAEFLIALIIVAVLVPGNVM